MDGTGGGMDLREVAVAPVEPGEENRYQRLMAAHHYLGALPKIGETLWYAAHLRGEWRSTTPAAAETSRCIHLRPAASIRAAACSAFLVRLGGHRVDHTLD